MPSGPACLMRPVAGWRPPETTVFTNLGAVRSAYASIGAFISGQQPWPALVCVVSNSWACRYQSLIIIFHIT